MSVLGRLHFVRAPFMQEKLMHIFFLIAVLAGSVTLRVVALEHLGFSRRFNSCKRTGFLKKMHSYTPSSAGPDVHQR